MSNKVFDLKWDGTFLGEITDLDIVEKYMINGKEYWNFSNSYSYVRTITSLQSCLIDEMKPIFNLKECKLGTHWVIYGKKKILLIRNMNLDGYFIEDEFVDYRKVIIDDIFTRQMQELYAFREIVGVTCSYDINFRVRKYKKKAFLDATSDKIRGYPLSYVETGLKPEKIGKCIPNTVLDKWFKDTNITEVTKRLLGYKDLDSIPDMLHNLNTQLEQVVMRVDKDLIRIVPLILDRIKSRLFYDS